MKARVLYVLALAMVLIIVGALYYENKKLKLSPENAVMATTGSFVIENENYRIELGGRDWMVTDKLKNVAVPLFWREDDETIFANNLILQGDKLYYIDDMKKIKVKNLKTFETKELYRIKGYRDSYILFGETYINATFATQGMYDSLIDRFSIGEDCLIIDFPDRRIKYNGIFEKEISY